MGMDDGFSHRWHITAPEAPDLTADQILSADPPEISIMNLFMFIAIIHELPRQYFFSTSALQLIKSEFDMHKVNIRKSNKFDYNMR
jgi:hypothetical protein